MSTTTGALISAGTPVTRYKRAFCAAAGRSPSTSTTPPVLVWHELCDGGAKRVTKTEAGEQMGDHPVQWRR